MIPYRREDFSRYKGRERFSNTIKDHATPFAIITRKLTQGVHNKEELANVFRTIYTGMNSNSDLLSTYTPAEVEALSTDQIQFLLGVRIVPDIESFKSAQEKLKDITFQTLDARLEKLPDILPSSKINALRDQGIGVLGYYEKIPYEQARTEWFNRGYEGELMQRIAAHPDRIALLPEDVLLAESMQKQPRIRNKDLATLIAA